MSEETKQDEEARHRAKMANRKAAQDAEAKKAANQAATDHAIRMFSVRATGRAPYRVKSSTFSSGK